MDLAAQPRFADAGVLGAFAAYVIGCFHLDDDRAYRSWAIMPWLPCEAGDDVEERVRSERLADAGLSTLLKALRRAGEQSTQDAADLAMALNWTPVNPYSSDRRIHHIRDAIRRSYAADRYRDSPLGEMVSCAYACATLHVEAGSYSQSHRPIVLRRWACGKVGTLYAMYHRIVGDRAWDAAADALRYAVTDTVTPP